MASFWIEFEQAGQTRQVAFEKDMVSMGRDRGCDFVLDHPTISRQHAMIVYRHGSFLLVVQSRGGLTAVEGQAAQAPEIPLYDGSMITLGQYSFRFRSQMAQPKPAGMSSAPMASSPMGSGPMGGGPLGSGPLGTGPLGGTPMPGAMMPAEEEEKGGAGIMSWDEIAASSDAQDEGADIPEATDFQRLQAANKKKEGGVSPLVIGAAGFMAIVFVGLMLLLPDEAERDEAETRDYSDQPPMEISVACLGQAECRRDALAAYARAEDLIESRDVETGNLFEAYKRLLEAQAYLQEGGIAEMPSEMANWQRQHDELQQELEVLFRSLRMRFHQAESRERTDEMRDVIRTIQAYFPDRTSREYRQARAWQLDMQSRGLLQPGDL